MQRFTIDSSQPLKYHIMRKYSSIIVKAFACIISAALFSGCLKDTSIHTFTYSWYEPLYKTKAEVIADIKSNPPQAIVNAGKIFINGKYIYLNEPGKGIHIIDNSIPSSPKNIAFITIAGNVDMAIKGNTLYADLYNDLVTIDITNPLQIAKTNIIANAFPDNLYSSYGYVADSNKIIYDWKRHDTVIISKNDLPQTGWPGGGIYYVAPSPALQNSSSSSTPPGIAGSMSRFALVNNYLYAVGYTDLNIFNISEPQQPMFNDKVTIGSWNIETIFPFKNKLFIGSQNGMYIYNISNAVQPTQDGQFGHLRSCDPVVADDSFAYVTLRSGTACQGFSNQLDILNLNNFTNPSLVKSYNLTNPHGLTKSRNLLFICDGTDGLKIYNATDVNNLKLIKHFAGIETSDVIANGNIALVVAKDGLYQYDYSNANDIHLLSKVNVAE